MPLLRELGEIALKSLNQSLAVAPRSPLPADFEFYMTYLTEPHPWLDEQDTLRNKALFLDLVQAIRTVLTSHERQATEGGSPTWLMELLQYWHTHQSTVITLNYDTLIERAAAQTLVKWPHGQDHVILPENIYPRHLIPVGQRRSQDVYTPTIKEPSFELLKLHGSSNWFWSGTDSFRGETVYFGDWDDDLAEHRDLRPVIVPPVLDKGRHFRFNAIQALWQSAAQALRRSDRVFCLGYSIPATDLTVRYWLGEAVSKFIETSSEALFYIVNTDESISQRLADLLPRGLKPATAYCGTESPIPQFVNDLVAEHVAAPLEEF